MNGDSDVAEHCLRPRGGHEERFVGADDAVADVVELALLLFVNDFEIRNSGLAVGAPVDDVGAAIDQPLLIEADESFAHCAREAGVHGEVLARPVDGGAEALHLVEDRAPVLLLPFPDTLRKASRPSFWREVLSAANCRSTIIWVAMPA